MRAVLACAVMFAVAAASASADEASDIRDKLVAAQEQVHSMTMQFSAPSIGMTGVGTFVRTPAIAVHMTMAEGATKMEMYLVGQTIYQRVGTTPWLRIEWPDVKALQSVGKTINAAMHVTLGADVVDNGVTYGSITMQSDTPLIPGAPAVGPQTQTCTYDKRTFLMHGCSNGVFTETMTGYNDPASTVTLPPDARAAPAASPPPAPPPSP